jgi:hypothetical protein
MQRPEILVPTDAERESARDSSRLLTRSGAELQVRGAVETELKRRGAPY